MDWDKILTHVILIIGLVLILTGSVTYILISDQSLLPLLVIALGLFVILIEVHFRLSAIERELKRQKK
jgi:CHASE2 domain-containing sensor protein